MRAARESLGEAWGDVRAAWSSSGSAAGGSMPALQRRVLEFAQGRVQTFRDALAEFVAGYTEGAREVRLHPPHAALGTWPGADAHVGMRV